MTKDAKLLHVEDFNVELRRKRVQNEALPSGPAPIEWHLGTSAAAADSLVAGQFPNSFQSLSSMRNE